MAAIIWLSLMAALLIVEGMTSGLFTIWFAIGSLAAAFCALAGAGILWQLVTFFAVSVLLYIFTRPAAMKLMKKDRLPTNVERLAGKSGLVIEDIDTRAQTGRVRLGDIEWNARTQDEGALVKKGSTVIVLGVQGNHLIVREDGK